jgi:hypothetical protein
MEQVRSGFAWVVESLRSELARTRQSLLAAVARVQEGQVESRMTSAELAEAQVESHVDSAELAADSAELLSDQVNLLAGLAELQQGQADLQASVDAIRASLTATGASAGPALARFVLHLMHGTLLLAGVDPSMVRREPLVDHAGVMFPLGHSVEIGTLRVGDLDYLVETLPEAGEHDIYHFAQVGRLYEQEIGRPPAGLLLAVLRISKRNLHLAQQTYHMWVVAGEVVDG